MTRPDTPSYDELRQDAARHWREVAAVRDARYQTVRQMIEKPWRCPVCGSVNERGGVCKKCHEARLVEVD